MSCELRAITARSASAMRVVRTFSASRSASSRIDRSVSVRLFEHRFDVAICLLLERSEDVFECHLFGSFRVA